MVRLYASAIDLSRFTLFVPCTSSIDDVSVWMSWLLHFLWIIQELTFNLANLCIYIATDNNHYIQFKLQLIPINFVLLIQI